MLIIDERFYLRIMRPHVAVGIGSGKLSYDILPGDLEVSIMVHQIKSTDRAVMMLKLGRKIIHK